MGTSSMTPNTPEPDHNIETERRHYELCTCLLLVARACVAEKGSNVTIEAIGDLSKALNDQWEGKFE